MNGEAKSLLDSLESYASNGAGHLCDWKINPSRVYISPKEAHPSWIRFTRTRAPAAKLIRLLQNHSPPPYVHVIPGHLPEPPEDLRQYLRNVIKKGDEIADAELFEDTIEHAPEKWKRFISGGSKVCHFSKWKNAAFLGSLFHHIQMNSPVDVELSTWDLYHGHMFIHVTQEKEEGSDTKLLCDLGILFHAKEFPLEYRRDKFGKIIPIGSANAGGSQDVRIGSKCSISDEDFYLRNYLWMLSTNEVVLLDTTAPDVQGIVQNKEFHTISSFCFEQVADINYFPDKMFGGGIHQLLAEEERRDSIKFLEKKYSENSTENKSGGGPSKGMHTPENVSGIVAMMKSSKKHRWFASQVAHMLSVSSETATYIFATPRASLTSPTLLIRQALLTVTREISRLDNEALTKLDTVLKDTKGDGILQNRIDKHAHHFLLQEIATERKRRIDAKRESERRLLQQLIDKKFELKHAERALELTRSQATGTMSAFRAENLLQATFARYRPQELAETYGNKDFDMEFVLAYQRHAFYTESTLRAIELDMKEKIGPSAAGAKIAEIVAKETHDRYVKHLQ